PRLGNCSGRRMSQYLLSSAGMVQPTRIVGCCAAAAKDKDALTIRPTTLDKHLDIAMVPRAGPARTQALPDASKTLAKIPAGVAGTAAPGRAALLPISQRPVKPWAAGIASGWPSLQGAKPAMSFQVAGEATMLSFATERGTTTCTSSLSAPGSADLHWR